MLRVLGIDPGSTVTGWGIVETKGTTLHHITHGCIRTQAQESLPQRLGKIFTELTRIIKEHQPHVAAVEEIFISINVQSALKLGHARGVAIAAANNQGLPIHEYSALQVKKSVVGYGHAEKQQMQEMTRILLCMAKKAPQDAADALGVAICHINHMPTQKLRQSARSQTSKTSPPRVSTKIPLSTLARLLNISPETPDTPMVGLLSAVNPATKEDLA